VREQLLLDRAVGDLGDLVGGGPLLRVVLDAEVELAPLEFELFSTRRSNSPPLKASMATVSSR
jgi:hypothetical protein